MGAKNQSIYQERNRELLVLVSILVSIFWQEREKDNPQIKGETPILEIEQVVFDALADGSVSAPAVHLGPPGNTHLETMAVVVPGHFVEEFFHEVARYNNRHRLK